jgi:hypothetical protein
MNSDDRATAFVLGSATRPGALVSVITSLGDEEHRSNSPKTAEY